MTDIDDFDAIESAPAPAPGPVATATRCIHCGYELLGLDPTAVCPECATPIERSLQGTWLQFADGDYLRSLHRGVVLILIGMLLSAVVLIATIALSIALTMAAAGGSVISQRVIAIVPLIEPFLSVGVSVFSFVGWWMLTAPDPAYTGVDKGQMPRRLIRVAVAIQAAVALTNLPLALLVQGAAGLAPGSPLLIASAVGGVAAFGASLLQFFAAMLYLRWLGRRVPNRRLVDRAGMYMWLLPIIFVIGAFCFMVGPLICVILYAMLLNDLRLDLRTMLGTRADL